MSAQVIPIRERIDVTHWTIDSIARYAHDNGWRDMRVTIEGETLWMERVW